MERPKFPALWTSDQRESDLGGFDRLGLRNAWILATLPGGHEASCP